MFEFDNEPTMEEELAAKRREELRQTLLNQQLMQKQQQAGGGGGSPLSMISSMMGNGSGGGGGLSSMFGGGASGGASNAGLNALLDGTGSAASGAGGASAGGGGAMSSLASFWPAAVVIAGIANESHAKDKGYRREGSDYTKDLITGKVLYQDVDQRWAPKLFGEKDSMGLGGDMRAASALGGLDFKKSFKHFTKDSSIAKIFKKIF